MILYNGDYEFVGISDSCVKKLNFPSFNAMKYRISGDFANLFIEKKGFLTNFKYISWIDYLQQEGDKAKAIIKSGDNSYYKVSLGIEIYYFADGEKGYLITIKTMSEFEMDSLELENSNDPFEKDSIKASKYSVNESDDFFASNESDEFSFEESNTFMFDSFEGNFGEDRESSNDKANEIFEEPEALEEEKENLKEDKEVSLKKKNFEDEFPDYTFEEDEEKEPKKKESEKLETKYQSFDEEFEKSFNNSQKDENSKIDQNEKSDKSIKFSDDFEFEFSNSEKIEKAPENEIKNEALNPVPSPDEFFQAFEMDYPSTYFETKDTEKETFIENKKSEPILNQEDIDKIIEIGESCDIPIIKEIKVFSSDNYNLDEVSKELQIEKSSLIDFLIDFVHHINQVKKFIYNAIEVNDVQSVKKAVFMVKGLCFNLRIEDIYELLNKIYTKNYRSGAEVVKDLNSVYKKVEMISQKVGTGGEIFKFDQKNIREFISSINHSKLPDALFQDMVDSFIKTFNSSKELVEESLNPDELHKIERIFKELSNIARSLDIDELNSPINRIIKNSSSVDVEFDRLIMDWIDLSSFVEKLK
jgi:hypothetical protein